MKIVLRTIFPFSTASAVSVLFGRFHLKIVLRTIFSFSTASDVSVLLVCSLRSVVTVLHLHIRVQRSLRSRGFASRTVGRPLRVFFVFWFSAPALFPDLIVDCIVRLRRARSFLRLFAACFSPVSDFSALRFSHVSGCRDFIRLRRAAAL